MKKNQFPRSKKIMKPLSRLFIVFKNHAIQFLLLGLVFGFTLNIFNLQTIINSIPLVYGVPISVASTSPLSFCFIHLYGIGYIDYMEPIWGWRWNPLTSWMWWLPITMRGEWYIAGTHFYGHTDQFMVLSDQPLLQGYWGLSFLWITLFQIGYNAILGYILLIIGFAMLFFFEVKKKNLGTKLKKKLGSLFNFVSILPLVFGFLLIYANWLMVFWTVLGFLFFVFMALQFKDTGNKKHLMLGLGILIAFLITYALFLFVQGHPAFYGSVQWDYIQYFY